MYIIQTYRCEIEKQITNRIEPEKTHLQTIDIQIWSCPKLKIQMSRSQFAQMRANAHSIFVKNAIYNISIHVSKSDR